MKSYYFSRGASTVVLAVITLVVTFFAGVVAVPQAEAFYGQGSDANSSPYLNLINWVDWQDALDEEPDYDGNGADGRAGTISKEVINQAGGVTVTSTTRIGDSVVNVQCTLSNTSGDLSLHAPGQYSGDTFDNYYDAWSGTKPLSGALTGIGASGKSNTREIAFDVSCNASLSRPNQADTPLPISGLVFANAEAIDLNEFFNIAPQKINPDVPVKWRVLENPAPQCGTDYSLYLVRGTLEASSSNKIAKSNLPNVEMENALQIFGPKDNCYERNKNYDGPFVSVFAEGASGARVQTYPQSNYGANYLAIGVVLTTDFSDGDSTKAYGNAAAMIQPFFSGGELASTSLVFNRDNRNVYQVKSSNLSIATKAQDLAAAQRNFGTFPRIGNNTEIGVDGDLAASVTGNFFTFTGDDSVDLLTQRIDDEDAVAAPLLVPALADNTYRLNVTCQPAPTGTTKVAAWLDWNANSSFESTEKVISDCVNNTATFKWTPTAQQLPVVTKENRNPRKAGLRIIITTDTDVLDAADAANATYLNGEVEDHPVTLVLPNLQLVKQIVGADNVQLSGVLANGWDLTATGETSTALFTDTDAVQTNTQTTADDGIGFWRLNLESVSDQDEIDLTDPQFAKQQISLTEKSQVGYQLAPQISGGAQQNLTCSPVVKPERWGSIFAWPNSVPVVSNIDHAANPGAKVQVDAHSVLDCVLKNQPYAQISVTPAVNAEALQDTGLQIDSGLQFAGEYTCTAPNTSVWSGIKVSGTWGPITLGETWTSDVTEDKIPLGAECEITQNSITSTAQTGVDNANPVEDSLRYEWQTQPSYTPAQSVSADAPESVAGAGHEIPVVTITNTVQGTTTASVKFTKVAADDVAEGNGQKLSGAEFTLDGANGTVNITVKDADKESNMRGENDANPNGGEFVISKLPAGRYTLTETKAPLGYELGNTAKSFEITPADIANGTLDLGEIVNQPVVSGALPSIPLSGGMSTFIFTAFGAAVLALAAAVGIPAIKRRKEHAVGLR